MLMIDFLEYWQQIEDKKRQAEVNESKSQPPGTSSKVDHSIYYMNGAGKITARVRGLLW